ncbi:MAG: FtsX-like permease family protein [Candidatus Avoscillospira sp.]
MLENILSLAFQGTRRKKRSSLLIFAVLLVSFSSAIVVLSLVGSISKTNAEFRLNTYGEWYCGIPSGMEEDAQWLENQQWVKAIGKAGNYGTINTAVGQTGFGTLDNSLLSIGRIQLDEGTFPTSDDEIAMEADALSALGCDYKLGQEITLLIDVPYKDQLIPVERSYTLCGVIHEYSNLWVLNRNSDNRLLVSAVVTEASAEAVLEAAMEYITNPENRKLVIPIPQYFLAVDEADRETACNSINGWLSSTRTGDFGDIWVCENTAAYPDAVSRDYDNFYVYIIAAVTMIAVLCVYIMQMSGEIHSFAVLRSCGITKPQMALLVLTETLILMLPAIVLGIPCGTGLTWLALRLTLYSGSVSIQVAIPYDTLLAVIGLWMAAVLISRLIMFFVTVHTPLTGRMQLQSGKSRQVNRLRSMLIILLLSAFGAVSIYTDTESIRPNYLREYWSLCPAYTIWEDTTVSATKTDLIKQVPGVVRVDGFGEMEIGLSFDGMDEQTVWIYAIDEEGWTETFDFSGIKASFHNGELVLMCFPENSGEEYILPKNQITLKVYSPSGECLAESQTDAFILQIPEMVMNRALAYLWEPYTIFCSESYLKQLLASMESGQQWDKYIAGEEFGYDRVYVGVDLNSDYLSTDVAMADLCKENGLKCDNRRQQFQSLVQENVQTLILLYSSGICIALVVLLILSSALSLEAEQEKRHFGILRAIGMSKRQMRRKIFAKAFMRSLTAVVIGWVLYGGYLILERMTANPTDYANPMEALASAVYALTYHGCDIQRVLLISGICLFIPLSISLLAKRKLMKGDLAL